MLFGNNLYYINKNSIFALDLQIIITNSFILTAYEN